MVILNYITSYRYAQKKQHNCFIVLANSKINKQNIEYKKGAAMPEIPEVEAFKSYITAHCLRKQIEDIKVTDTSSLKKVSVATFKKTLIGHRFTKVQRLGKYLIIDIAHTDKKLVMHFGLTGSLVYTTDKQEKVRFSRVAFIFAKGMLHWTDLRKFGKVWLVDDLQKIQGLKKLGTDALSITKKQFLALLADNESKNIKALLMDQELIAGIGNEYSDEILFHAGIDPHHKVKDLSSATRTKLYNKLHAVLRSAIKTQHRSSKSANGPDFTSKESRKAFASTYLQAHRHVDMVCPKNKNHKLKKATIAGRTSYYCPEDQT